MKRITSETLKAGIGIINNLVKIEGNEFRLLEQNGSVSLVLKRNGSGIRQISQAMTKRELNEVIQSIINLHSIIDFEERTKGGNLNSQEVKEIRK